MRKVISMVMVCIMLWSVLPTSVQAQGEDMRGAWIATVYNIDFPSPHSKNNPEAQKREYITLLDKLQAIGMNAVFVQVRPKADAFYKSSINPWSDILTGIQGQDPGYDPMSFMIDEAHKRGMAFHAWLNPYRVTTSGTDVNALAPTHPARLHPEWTISYKDKLYYNPALPAVQQHIVDTVKEIVENYDIDGVHFDDYFYPSYYPLPEGEGPDGEVANSRREDINQMVRQVSEVIERTAPEVSFGISPIGIWKNKKNDPQGSNTAGGEGYYSVYADATAWVENEWIDYIIPQIYWEIGHPKADYATLAKWWAHLVKGTDVKLYIGQGVYKDEIAKDIAKQLLENEKYPQIEGNVYYGTRDIIANRMGVADTLKRIYQIIDEDIQLPVNPEPSQPAAWYKEGKVMVDKLNMRSGPGTQYEALTKLDKGTKVKVLETTNEWYKIQLIDGTVGYTSIDFIEVSKDIRLVINDKQVMTEVAPILIEGTTLVPLRAISENLGIEVRWDSIKKEVTLSKGTDVLKLTIGNPVVNSNGNDLTLDISPKLINGVTMVPIRFIAENLKAEVMWHQVEKVIEVKEIKNNFK